MEYSILIISPDESLHRQVEREVGANRAGQVYSFYEEGEALNWIHSTKTEIDLVILSIEDIYRPAFLEALSKLPALKHAMFTAPLGPAESVLLKGLPLLSSNLETIMVRPFRITQFLEKTTTLLRRYQKKPSAALILSGGANETGCALKDYLGQSGFERIYEVSDIEMAFQVLNERPDTSLFAVGWDLPSSVGSQVMIRALSQPKFSRLPILIVSSIQTMSLLKNVTVFLGKVPQFLPIAGDPSFGQQLKKFMVKIKARRQSAAFVLEAEHFLSLGRRDPALDVLSMAAKNFPDVASLHERIADLIESEDAKLRDMKTQSLERARRLEPGRRSVANKLQDLYATTGQHKESVRLLRQLIPLFGFDEHIRTELAKSLISLGDYGGAAIELRHALNINPDCQEANSLREFLETIQSQIPALQNPKAA